MFLTCLIGNMEFLCMHHTGIGHNLAARGKSHEFFRVAAGTWGIFSSCGRHKVDIIESRRGWPFETRVCSPKTGLWSKYDGHLGKLNYAWQENTDPSGGEPGGQGTVILLQLYWYSYQFSRRIRHRHLLKH